MATASDPWSVVLLMGTLGPVGGVEHGGGDAVLVPIRRELGLPGEARSVEVASLAVLVAVEDVGQAVGWEADRFRAGAVGVVGYAGGVPGGRGVRA
jgi:hypothetical protein